MTWKSVGIMCTQTDLWVMKEYGVAASWTKVWVEAEACVPTRVLCFRQDEQVLVITPSGRIASLDIKTKHSQVFGVKLNNSLVIDDFVLVDSFVESLVLLDKCCISSRWDVISI
ncbi:f-box family protein [Corchorus olitorius]|uniref:F-box family protein n=1 Tax=Corchorus olitorius TaxID=93759 RepID=A0A1R3K958_9ROSI|nr:f-box family protein [Corchorus olitorius]